MKWYAYLGSASQQNGVKEHAYLIEANRVEAKAKVEEADGDPIKKPKRDDGLSVDWLRLEETQALRDVQRAEGHQQVPARQCRRCIPKLQPHRNKKLFSTYKIKCIFVCICRTE